MGILENAKDSIVLGLEDYSSTEPGRMVSCTRNLFSGILLIYKHKLLILSPPQSEEALIKQRVVPVLNNEGEVRWIGKGDKTVDVQQIQERFKSLHISVDWKRVKKIQKFRNNIEHYYVNQSADSMKALISNSFILIKDFLSKHLKIDPKNFLGDDAWDTLVSVSEVYDRERKECVEAIESLEWENDILREAIISFECSNCFSTLISIRDPSARSEKNEFYCRSCGQTWNYEAVIEAAVHDYFGHNEYLYHRDGSEPAIIYCPECSRHTYVLEEQCCAVCGESAEQTCRMCSTEIPPGEIDGSGYCGWCQRVMSRDD